MPTADSPPRYCPNCSYPVADAGEKFCGACGAPLAGDIPAPPPDAPIISAGGSVRSRRWWSFGVAAVAAAGVAVLLILLLASSGSNSGQSAQVGAADTSSPPVKTANTTVDCAKRTVTKMLAAAKQYKIENSSFDGASVYLLGNYEPTLRDADACGPTMRTFVQGDRSGDACNPSSPAGEDYVCVGARINVGNASATQYFGIAMDKSGRTQFCTPGADGCGSSGSW